MSAMIVVRAVCHPDEALLVSECASTHPAHARHGWLGGAVHVTLDVPHVPEVERDAYRQRVTDGLDACRRARPPQIIPWETWCERGGAR